jgi:acetyltransferase-like isoleucine patch superfamily enzyme
MKFVKHIYHSLKNIFNTNLFMTFYINSIVKGQGKCIVYKKSALKIHRTAKIQIDKGTLRINDKWTSNDPFPLVLSMGKNARLIVKDSFRIYSGGRIYINNDAELILGHGYFNNNLNLACFQKIEIGMNCLIADNVTIRDSDNHVLLIQGFVKTKSVKICDHVWIGMNSTILKGVTIGKGAIIAAGSVVTKDIPEKCLAGGVPARILRENVEWN